jgi:NADH dehydrogenase FAD-containing subunit
MLNLHRYTERRHQVTLIGPSAYHYYSGMGPGLLAGIYRPQDVRFHIKKMVEDRGGCFVQGWVSRIEADRKILILKSGDEISYDVVSCNTGSYVPANADAIMGDNIFAVKPIENLIQCQQIIKTGLDKAASRILVIGGGAAALELTGNLWRIIHSLGKTASIAILAGRNFLSSMPQSAQRYARNSLTTRNIDIVEGAKVSRLAENHAVLEDGREFFFNIALLAWGIQPSRLFFESGIPTGPDGGLLVNTHLQSVAYPEIFGGGDCISFEKQRLDKVGVYAVRQNPILYNNLLAALEGGDLQAFQPQNTYLLIYNLGNGTGIFYRGKWVWKGRLIFFLKDYIDRKFMRKFQVSGETDPGTI